MRQALQRLLWPLPPGGTDAKGWPLGRRVKTRELEVEVSRVAGVSEVTGLKLFAPGDRRLAGAADAAAPMQRQSLELAGWQLPELLAVAVADDPDTARRPS